VQDVGRGQHRRESISLDDSNQRLRSFGLATSDCFCSVLEAMPHQSWLGSILADLRPLARRVDEICFMFVVDDEICEMFVIDNCFFRGSFVDQVAVHAAMKAAQTSMLRSSAASANGWRHNPCHIETLTSTHSLHVFQLMPRAAVSFKTWTDTSEMQLRTDTMPYGQIVHIRPRPLRCNA
jgi:hypothetical protein